MMVKIALKNKHEFYRLAAFGFSIMYIFQIFLTVGGGIKFIPLTGVTLPFISYGGSSVLATMLMFFVLQGIYMVALEEGDMPYVEQKEFEGAGELEYIDYDAEDFEEESYEEPYEGQ